MRPSERRAPAIGDVARAAGVSVPTVSRVISGSTPVTAAKRARVLAAIDELGYRPNGAARALVTGRQSAVAVLAGDTTRYGYARTIQGIEEAARLEGYSVTITVVDSDQPNDVASSVDLALSHPVAGVIVLKFDAPGVKALQALPARIPVVAAAGSRGRTVPHAVLDDTAGAVAATDYLLSLGHRTVHHLAVPASRPRQGRAAGWRKALEQAGASVPQLHQASWDPADGYHVALDLLRSDEVTAVLCGNDELAFGVLRAAYELGRRVPDDLSVVGFDGQPLAALSTPALTTVEQDFVELGRCSFELLATQFDHGSARRATSPTVLTPRLRIRESTGPVPSGPR